MLTPSAWHLGLLALLQGSSRAIDLSWHAPAQSVVNNLTGAVNGTGTYGFIFDSSDTAQKEYGTYNWCNMPHVRKTEYIKATDEYKLKYVEVIHRHHKRTPYAANSFPVESYEWNCNDEGLYTYAQGLPASAGDGPSAAAYWQGYVSPINPFTQAVGGWVGTCQFPQETLGGLDDSWQHGADLYGVYHDVLGFLPSRDSSWQDKVQYRVTQNVITSQVAGMLINGMWASASRIPLIIEADGIDSLEPGYTCTEGSALFSDIQSSSNAVWQEHLDAAAALYSQLDSISGVPSNESSFHVSMDHYFDNLSARQCHAKPLPCKLVNGENTSICITQDMANTVYRLGEWEYSQIYRDNSSSLAASTTTFGVWIEELASHLRTVLAGTNPTIYYHNVAHDGSLSRLLSILQIDEMVWPGMGAEVVFELYEKTGSVKHRSTGGASASGYYVRVLWGGQTMKSSHPDFRIMEMVPVETLLEYFDGLAGKDASLVLGKCNGSISLSSSG